MSDNQHPGCPAFQSGVARLGLGDVKKKIVEEHLRRELDIFEMILKMPDEDVKEFYEWYISHPYAKGIEEVIRIVRGEGNSWENEVRKNVGSGRNKEIERCWDNDSR